MADLDDYLAQQRDFQAKVSAEAQQRADEKRRKRLAEEAEIRELLASFVRRAIEGRYQAVVLVEVKREVRSLGFSWPWQTPKNETVDAVIRVFGRAWLVWSAGGGEWEDGTPQAKSYDLIPEAGGIATSRGLRRSGEPKIVDLPAAWSHLEPYAILPSQPVLEGKIDSGVRPFSLGRTLGSEILRHEE